MRVRDGGCCSQYKGCVKSGDAAEVASYLARWKPAKGTAPAAAAFARSVVVAAGPGGQDRAKCLLWAASKLAAWAIGLGMDPAAEVLLHPSVIERFAAHAPGISGAARRTLRTNLRFLARCVVPHLDPADAPLPRERAKKPYTPAEIDGYLALADAQPTAGRRMRAVALVCLGAGAGLIRCDLRQARGTDVVARSGGVIVTVRGVRPRVVPVLARYQPRLLQAAAFAGEQFLTGGNKPERGNVTNPLTRSLAGGGGLPPLDTSRLRATWLAEAAVLIGLPAFMHAAGISCCQRLGDITASLDPGLEQDAVALLGALAASPP
jgi:integrase